RPDRGKQDAAVEQAEPVAERPHHVRLLGAGVDHLHRVGPQRPAVQVLAGQARCRSGPNGRKSPCRSRGRLRMTTFAPARSILSARAFQSFSLKSGTGPSALTGKTLKWPTAVVTSLPTTGVK